MPGINPGSTIIIATAGADNHLGVIVSSRKIATPKIGNAAPTSGTGVTNPYDSGTEITGVNLTRNKYVGVYEVDNDNTVVGFKLIKLTSASINK